MDRTCADLPWQVWLEVDGKDVDIPKVIINRNIFSTIIVVQLFTFILEVAFILFFSFFF